MGTTAITVMHTAQITLSLTNITLKYCFYLVHSRRLKSDKKHNFILNILGISLSVFYVIWRLLVQQNTSASIKNPSTSIA